MNKKIIAYILVVSLLVLLVPQGLYSAASDTIYAGIPGGDAIIKNAAFTDISKNANADNIMKMAVYSIIREYGSKTYKPSASASRQDILAGLVRIIGQQDAAVQKGNQLKQQDPLLDQVGAYLRGHIEVAKTNGIITQPEIDALSKLTKADLAAVDKEVTAQIKKNWKMTQVQKAVFKKARTDQKSFDKTFKNPGTREETAVWIARALNLTPVTGEKTMKTYDYTDWKQIKSEDIPYVEAVLRKNMMMGATADKFSPKGAISKGELATILNAVTNEKLDTLGFTTGYGRISQIKNFKSPSAMEDATANDITIDTATNETININIQNKTGKNVKPNEAKRVIPVIKGGKVGNEALLTQNDMVEYTLDKDNQVVLIQVGSLKEINGTYNGYDSATGTAKLSDKNGSYRLKVLPGSIILAQGTPVNIGGIRKDIPVKAVYSGTMIEGTLKSMDVDIPADKINNTEISGKIVFASAGDKILKIKNENGDMQYLDISEDTTVYINGIKQSIDNLGYDQDAIIKIADNKVKEINIYSDLPEDVPNQDIFTGKIRDVVGNNLMASTDAEPDKQGVYLLDANTVIIKDKNAIDKSKLRQGDRFKAYINSTAPNYISRLELQSSGVNLDNIYKGDIKEVLPGSSEVVLTNIYTYGFNDWVKKGDYQKYKLSDDIILYKDGEKISAAKLKDNIGKTIYAASKTNYGEEQLVQGIMKTGYEDSLYKKIKDIKWSNNQLTLSDDRVLGFQNGAIVIKDGKLLDTVDLTNNTGAFIIQNKTAGGVSSAPIISLDNFNGFTNYRISKGYLHNMGEDYYTVENGYRLTNNAWEKWGEFIFQLSNDASIYDNTITNSFITADKFAESRYKPYTYTWPNYLTYNYGKEFHEDDEYHNGYENYRNSGYYHEHCLVYTVTDENGMTKAINIYKKDKESFNPVVTNDERMTSGKIETLDTTNSILTVKNAMDYSSVYEKWQQVSTPMPFDLTKALIMKDNKKIDFTELRANDNIYVLSLNGDAIFVFIE